MIINDPVRTPSAPATPRSTTPEGDHTEKTITDPQEPVQGVLIPERVHAPTQTVPLALVVFVAGTPAPQGSKRAFAHKQSGKVVTVEMSKRVKPWRADVREALLDDTGQPSARYDGAVVVRLEFVMPRPKSMPVTRPTPPHLKTPDVDKLARSTLDAITSAGVIPDDKHVVRLEATKRTAERDENPGCYISIGEATP